jgi:Flp pilus assembly protein TadG
MKRTTRRSSILPTRRLGGERRGAATVELALCLPVLLTTALGMIETCNLMFTQARMQSVCFESARLACRPTTSNAVAATSAQVISYADTLLTQLGVTGTTVTISPATITGLTPGTAVTVTITASFSSNSVTHFVLSSSLSLTSTATMIIE